MNQRDEIWTAGRLGLGGKTCGEDFLAQTNKDIYREEYGDLAEELRVLELEDGPECSVHEWHSRHQPLAFIPSQALEKFNHS